MITNAITTGSLAAVARKSGKPLAEAFLSIQLIAIADVSGSMSQHDSRGGRSRIDVLREELAKLQADHPGKLGLVAFSDHAVFLPGGVPPPPQGGTDLAGALRYCREFDVPPIRFVVISDGTPDDPDGAIAVARTFTGQISTIFAGNEADTEAQDFLRRLANAAKGHFGTASRVCNLADSMRPLLAGGVA